MKIHSKWKDFYDSALSHGIDSDLHYVRHEERISYKHDLKWRLPADYNISNADNRGIGDTGTQIIGFCGILYPYMPLTEAYRGVVTNEYRSHHLYFPDECDQFPEIIGDSWRRGSRWHRTYANDQSRQAKDFLSNRIVDDRPFIEIGAPAFLIRPGYDHGSGIILVKNPCLKDLSFFKVKDPFTAFQEIAGYLGNQLVQRKEPDQIADKYRVTQHGFDKWSFRKHKDQKSLDNPRRKG